MRVCQTDRNQSQQKTELLNNFLSHFPEKKMNEEKTPLFSPAKLVAEIKHMQELKALLKHFQFAVGSSDKKIVGILSRDLTDIETTAKAGVEQKFISPQDVASYKIDELKGKLQSLFDKLNGPDGVVKMFLNLDKEYSKPNLDQATYDKLDKDRQELDISIKQLRAIYNEIKPQIDLLQEKLKDVREVIRKNEAYKEAGLDPYSSVAAYRAEQIRRAKEDLQTIIEVPSGINLERTCLIVKRNVEKLLAAHEKIEKDVADFIARNKELFTHEFLVQVEANREPASDSVSNCVMQ